MMKPNAYLSLKTTLTDEINAGRVAMSRIDDVVSRILSKKSEQSLFERPYTDCTNLPAIGRPAHEAVARKAVAKSPVLRRDARHALPIKTGGRIYLAGSNVDDIVNRAGG